MYKNLYPIKYVEHKQGVEMKTVKYMDEEIVIKKG